MSYSDRVTNRSRGRDQALQLPAPDLSPGGETCRTPEGWRQRRQGALEITLDAADTYRVIARLQSPFRAAHRTSFGGRLADADETPVIAGALEELGDELAGPQEGASPLIEWLAERDVLLQQKELEPESAEGETTLAVAHAADAAAADREPSEREALGTPAAHELWVDRERMLAQAEEAPGEPEAALVRTAAPVSAAGAAVLGHLRFAPFPEGYRLVASDERCALPGDMLELEERRFVVTRVGRSPLPADERPCAFLASTTA